MKKIVSLLLLIPAMMLNLQGQDKSFKASFIEAEYYMHVADYVSALRYYENLLSVDPDNSNLNFLCGFCLLKSGGDIQKTIHLFERAVQSADPSYKDGSYKERNAPMDSYFLLGRTYHINNQFDHAIESYAQYRRAIDKKNFAETEYVNAHIKACELGKSMINDPITVDMQPLGSNLEFNWDIYNPVVSGNDSILVFLSDRNNRKTLMVSEKKNNTWSKPLGINPQIGLPGNIYPVSLSYDGTELYIVHNDYFNADIYVSHHDGSRWSRAIKLNNNINTKYTESHACISREGTTLYFTSNRKGGIGGQDIYQAERISGDEWGDAVNLGHSVNTYYNEESPFITNQDQRLYFSSQGHNTMGGYDIFYSNKNVEGSWDIPQNIGYPVNSSDDDLFFNPGWEDGHALYTIKSGDPGSFKNIVTVRLPDREELYAEESSLDNEPPQVQAISLNLIPDETEKPAITFSSLGMYYILNNILFDYNEYSINEEVTRDVERITVLMRKYPEIDIELTGNSDALEAKGNNIELSGKRAEAVAQYLMSNGIDPDRISIKAAGESNPVAINQYEDGSDAPEGRKLNRHVSIKISNLSNDRIRVADIFVPDELVPREDKGYTVLLLKSDECVSNIPEEFLNEKVSTNIEYSYLYTAGQFEKKTEAVNYLNEVIDLGYPDAVIIEKKNMEHLTQDNFIPDRVGPLSFTIQIMALRLPREASYFKNFTMVKRFDCKDGLYRFVTGEYDSKEEARKELTGVRRKGYKDAFIMPVSHYAEMAIKK